VGVEPVGAFVSSEVVLAQVSEFVFESEFGLEIIWVLQQIPGVFVVELFSVTKNISRTLFRGQFVCKRGFGLLLGGIWL